MEITQETVICEVSIRRKKYFFIAMYRSPNQSNEEFDVFYGIKFSTLSRMPNCIVLI